jgi:hypothetical protein
MGHHGFGGGSKCRLLPCRTFLSTGSCPYNDRCVFIHDPRIASASPQLRIRKKTKDDSTIDAFFWTPMNNDDTRTLTDQNNIPQVSQFYIVSTPLEQLANTNKPYAVRELRTAIAVYSMWNYYLDFLATDPLSTVSHIPRRVPAAKPADPVNRHTGRRRLPIFVKLASSNESKPRS